MTKVGAHAGANAMSESITARADGMIQDEAESNLDCESAVRCRGRCCILGT